MGLASEDSFQSKHRVEETDDRLKEQKSFSTARLGQKSGDADDDIEGEDAEQFIGYRAST